MLRHSKHARRASLNYVLTLMQGVKAFAYHTSSASVRHLTRNIVFRIITSVNVVPPKYFCTPLLFLPKEWQFRGCWDYTDYVKITPILFVES